MSRVSKGVSFNVEEAFESSLFNYAMAQGKFSKYIKRLIAKEMGGGGLTFKREEVKTIEIFESRSTDDVDSFV